MDNQPNFRQAGVKSSGKLLIGASHAHHAAHGKRGMGNASIPSKFECILYAGSKEQDGFASRVSRFSENTADLPGPGHYSSPTSFTKPTHNKLAREGRVTTRDARFRQVLPGSGATMIAIGQTKVPGPGNYSSHEDFLAKKDSTNFNRSSTTGVFKPRQTFARTNYNNNESWQDEYPVPGPGHYDCHHTINRERRNRKDRGPVAVVQRQLGQTRSLSQLDQLSSTNGSGMMYNPSATGEFKNMSSTFGSSLAGNGENGGRTWKKVASKDSEESTNVPFSSALLHGTGQDTVLELQEKKEYVEEPLGRRGLVDDQPFGATSKRFTEHAPSKTPAVGQYEPYKYQNMLNTNTNGTGQGVTSSFVSSSSRPDMSQMHGVRATEDIDPGSYNPKFSHYPDFGTDRKASRAFKQLNQNRFGAVRNPRVARKPNPGPGSYDTVIPSDIQTMPEPHTLTMGNKTQRPQHTSTLLSPRRLRQYDGLIKGNSTVLAPHKAQLQSSIRPPGPAYYDPMSPALKKSFLLNQKKRWTS